MTIVVSYSELSDFRQCPAKHKWGWQDRLVKDPASGTPMHKGTAWHALMEAHYNNQPEDSPFQLLASWEEQGWDSDYIDLLTWMYRGYLQRWGNDNQWDVEAVEQKLTHPLTVADNGEEIWLGMTLDLLVKDQGRRWLVDHKSHGVIPKHNNLGLHEQFGLYSWVLRQRGERPFGVIYNSACSTWNKGDQKAFRGEPLKGTEREKSMDARYDRYRMNRTDAELDMIAAEAAATAKLAYSRHNHHERHPDPELCIRKCSFTEACLLGRRTGDNERTIQALIDQGYYFGDKRYHDIPS